MAVKNTGLPIMAVFAAVLLLASCNRPVGGQVTVTASGADAAAYRLIGGNWQPADDPEQFSFLTFGAYEVAVRCGDAVHMIAVTPDETLRPVLNCETKGSAGFSVNFDVQAVSGAVSVGFFYLNGISAKDAKSGTISVSNALTGEQDLVLVAADSSKEPIAAMMVTKNVSDGATYTMTMSSSHKNNLLAGGSLADYSGSIPSGWTLNLAMVAAITPRGTVVPMKAFTGGGGSYKSLNFASYDLASVIAREKSKAPYKSLARLIVGDGKALNFQADLPEVFDATMTHNYPPGFSNLSYGCGDLVGFHLQANWGHDKLFSALVTTGLLNGSTGYRLPDLTGVQGFAGVTPASGDRVKLTAEALCSNKTIGELSSAGLNKKPFQVRGLDLRIAGDVEEYVAP